MFDDSCPDCVMLNQFWCFSGPKGWMLCENCRKYEIEREERRQMDKEAEKRKLNGDKNALRAILLGRIKETGFITALIQDAITKGHEGRVIRDTLAIYKEYEYLTESQVDRFVEELYKNA